MAVGLGRTASFWDHYLRHRLNTRLETKRTEIHFFSRGRALPSPSLLHELGLAVNLTDSEIYQTPIPQPAQEAGVGCTSLLAGITDPCNQENMSWPT